MFSSLKAELWVSALMRRAEVEGAFATIIHKGDKDAGAALIKVRMSAEEVILYRPLRDMDGSRLWLPKGPATEKEMDNLIASRLDTDPDLWVIEVEDRFGRHFLTEAVENGTLD